MTGFLRAGSAGRAAGLAIALLGLLAASAAQAQAVRYVSVSGNDANPCTLAAPCKTLQRGIQRAPVRGEVRLLDSGDFGAGVTIAKSLTISGNGNTLILSGEAAITINNAAVTVALRDLLLNGLGVNSSGIVGAAAASLHIVGCEIARFAGDGIVAQSGITELFVSDTIARNNGFAGMRVDGSGATRVTVDNSRFENNGDRGASINDAQTSVTRSTFAGNGNDGLFVFSGAASVAWSTAAGNGGSGFAVDFADVQLESSVARRNAGGVHVIISSAIASISNMTVTENQFGIINETTVRTRGNNRVFGNGTDFLGGGETTPLGGT